MIKLNFLIKNKIVFFEQKIFFPIIFANLFLQVWQCKINTGFELNSFFLGWNFFFLKYFLVDQLTNAKKFFPSLGEEILFWLFKKKIKTRLNAFLCRKTPLLVPGVDHFSSANQINWENYVTKNKTVFESSFFSLLNAILVLN